MDDLLTEFLSETAESLSVLDVELARLEQEPGSRRRINSILRLVHTIKGTCGFLGLRRLEAVAHATENVLGQMRDGALAAPAALAAVVAGIDHIREILFGLESFGREPPGDDAGLIRQLDAAAAGVALDALAPQDRSTAADPAAGPAIAAGDPVEAMAALVGELAQIRDQLLQATRSRGEPDLAAPLQRLAQVTGRLQDCVTASRLQPIGSIWAKLPRMVRDLGRALGKRIDLQMHGADIALDRRVLEQIRDPLTHMLRNAADHGLETPAERVAAGKPTAGRIVLSARREAGHVVIEVTDDGRGLNLEQIRRKALELGLAGEAELQAMPERRLQEFIFAAGFSTAAAVTSISGRGVGMDVARTNVERIGGTIALSSVCGTGSTFAIRLPPPGSQPARLERDAMLTALSHTLSVAGDAA